MLVYYVPVCGFHAILSPIVPCRHIVLGPTLSHYLLWYVLLCAILSYYVRYHALTFFAILCSIFSNFIPHCHNMYYGISSCTILPNCVPTIFYHVPFCYNSYHIVILRAILSFCVPYCHVMCPIVMLCAMLSYYVLFRRVALQQSTAAPPSPASTRISTNILL